MTKRALVVDNDRFFVEFLTELLEAREYQVFKAYDGKEGISKLKGEDVGLLFVDMIMPKIDGKQLIEFTRNSFSKSHMPIVALSGAMIEQLDRLEKIGADYFLAKGPMEKMAKHIGRLLDKIEKGTTVPPSDKTVFNPGNLISRQISHELIQTVDFHQAINQSIGLGILVIDRDARIIAVNPMAFEILNKSINDVLERQIINIFPEKEKQKVLGALKKLLLEPHMRRIVFFATINSHTVRVIVSLLRIDGEIAGYILALEETSEWVEQV